MNRLSVFLLVALSLIFSSSSVMAQPSITISAGDTTVTVGAYGDAPFIATLDEPTIDFLSLRTDDIVLTCTCNATDGYFKPQDGELNSIEITFKPGFSQHSFWFVPTPMLEEDFASVEFTCSAEKTGTIATPVTVTNDKHEITVSTRTLQVVYKQPLLSGLRYGKASGEVIVATQTPLKVVHPLTVVVHRSEGTIQFPELGRLADTKSLELSDTAAAASYSIIAGSSSGPYYDRNASFNGLSLTYQLSTNYEWYSAVASSGNFDITPRPTQRGLSGTANQRFLIEGRPSEPIYFFVPEAEEISGDVALTAHLADKTATLSLGASSRLTSLQMSVDGAFGDFDLRLRPDTTDETLDQFDSSLTQSSQMKVYQRLAVITAAGSDYVVGDAFTVTVSFQYGPNSELTVEPLMPGCDVSPTAVTLSSSDSVATFTIVCDQEGTYSFDYIATGNEAHLFTHPAKHDFNIALRTITFTDFGGSQAVLFPTSPVVVSLSHPAENGLTLTPFAQGVTFTPATVEFAAGQRQASFTATPQVQHPEGLDVEIGFLVGGLDRGWYNAPSTKTITLVQPGLVVYADGYHPYSNPPRPNQLTHYVGHKRHYMLSTWVPEGHTATVTLVASPAGAVNISKATHELTSTRAYSDFYVTLLTPTDFSLQVLVTHGIKSAGYTYDYSETYDCTGKLRPVQIWRHCGPKETTSLTVPQNRRCIADKTHPDTNWNRLNDLKLNTYFNFTLYDEDLIDEEDNTYRGLSPTDELVITPYSEHIVFDPPKFTFVNGVSNVVVKIKGQVAGQHTVRFVNSGKNALWYQPLADQAFIVPVSGGLPLEFESAATVVAPALSLLVAVVLALLAL